MRKFVLATAMSAAQIGARFRWLSRNAAPPPRCVISDPDPPTNVRTRANGVIVGKL